MKHRTKLRIWSHFNETDRAMLRTSAESVDLSTLKSPEIQQLIDDMAKSMKQAEGIGLAAPQIGQSIRLAIVSGELDGQKEPFVLINPTVTVIGTEQIEGEEGCLSIPGVFGIVPRAANINIKSFNRYGEPWTINAQDLLARVIQHEVDHLNGVLFIDKTTKFTKGEDKLL